MSSNLIKDLSILSTIPESYFSKLIDKSLDCICNDIYESLNDGQDVTKVDIGIGYLYIKINGEEASYSFIPSDELENKLINMIEEDKSPLESKLEESLVSKILNVYKELL